MNRAPPSASGRPTGHARRPKPPARSPHGWTGDDDYDSYGYGHPEGYGHDDGWAYERGSGSADGPYGAYGGSLRPYRGRSPWLRPVAWVLAFVMGLGMVALAFSAVYRSAAGETDPAPAPASTPRKEVTGIGAFTYPSHRQP